MRDEIEPVAGNWYSHRDKGQTFQVIAIDEDRGVIEIQYVDGDLEAIDSDAWYDMDLEIAEPPEDERGPLDDDRTDDGRYSETARGYRDEPASNRPKSEAWEDEDEDDLDEDEDEDEDEDDDGWDGRESHEE